MRARIYVRWHTAAVRFAFSIFVFSPSPRPLRSTYCARRRSVNRRGLCSQNFPHGTPFAPRCRFFANKMLFSAPCQHGSPASFRGVKWVYFYVRPCARVATSPTPVTGRTVGFSPGTRKLFLSPSVVLSNRNPPSRP